MAKQPSKTTESAQKTVFATFQILKDNGGALPGREVIELIPKRVKLSDWELERYEKTGYVRWESLLHFYSVDCAKAGFLQKDKGVWILTTEGEVAMKKGAEYLFDAARKAYKAWRQSQPSSQAQQEVVEPQEAIDVTQEQKALLEQYEQTALDGIQKFVNSKNPYEFQDLVAALLKAMGYYISFNAKRGKDGGIDIIAYSDPLGTQKPRIKVQVKHRPESAVGVDVVKQLVANLNKDGDVGLFVTSGRFTSESERYSRESHVHVELIDFEKFMTLWQEHYARMTDEDKNRLPLHGVWFLGVNE